MLDEFEKHDRSEVEQIRERADPVAGQAHLLAEEIGERTAAGAVKAELPVEQNEQGLDGEPVVVELARGKGKKAVRPVAAPHVEPDETGERAVEERVDSNSETHVPDDDGPADERAGPVQSPHPAGGMPRPPARETRDPK